MAKEGLKIGLFIALIALIGILFAIFSQSASISTLNAKPSTVYVPAYSTLSCKETRTEYYPEADNALNAQFEAVPAGGYSYWCGSPTLGDSYFPRGCEVYLTSTGLFDRITRICNGDGTNCQELTSTQASNTWTTGSKSLHLNYNQKLYITAKGIFSTDYQIRMVAPVFGIVIEGQAIKPAYANKCNLQALLSENAIRILKSNPDYAKILATNQISEGVFPQVFITSYTQSYSDMRVIAKDGIYYFIEDIGRLCTIEQASDGKYVVSDNCKDDPSIQCYPGIGNCNSEGQLGTAPTATCVPGTLIGTSGGRKNVYGDQACYLKCNSAGVPALSDCTTIQKCSAGYTWNMNYECIEANDANAKDICEAGNNRWITKTNSDGSVTSYCELGKADYTVYFILVTLFLIGVVAILLVRINQKRR